MINGKTAKDLTLPLKNKKKIIRRNNITDE